MTVENKAVDIDSWRQGARFALEAVSKVDSICWLTDSMRVVCIKQATDVVIAERDRLPELGEVVVTKTQDGLIVAVTRQDAEGKVLSVLAESAPIKQVGYFSEGRHGGLCHHPDTTNPISLRASLDSGCDGGPYKSHAAYILRKD